MNPAQPATSLTRHEFLKLTTGIISGVSLTGLISRTTDAAEPLDALYLEKGLTAMTRAKTWFDAHWGAGILAGYYLCRDHPLDVATVTAIKQQMDTVISGRQELFLPQANGRAAGHLISTVPDAALVAMKGGIRAHGHAIIFASLATRALRDAPQMAGTEIIDRLRDLSHQIARLSPQKPPADAAGYRDTQEMVEATFASLLRFRDLLGHPEVRRPNFTHMITHTEALMNLEEMGFSDHAARGHSGHRTHINAPVPAVTTATADAKTTLATLESVMNGTFWTNPANLELWKEKWNQATNPNGDWIASGHLFKVLYSHSRLVSRIDDPELVRLCSAILLERYVNPSVQGG